MPPNSGFSVALFANYTLDGIKVVLALSLESETGTTCAGWDGETAAALSHQAFQPFTWADAQGHIRKLHRREDLQRE